MKTFRLLFAVVLALVVVPGFSQQDDAAAKPVVPVIYVTSGLVEKANPMDFFGGPTVTLRELIDSVDRAAADDEVAAVLVRFVSPSWGFAQAMEFERALGRLVAADKPVYVSMDSGRMTDYLAASPATEIVLPPVGAMDLHGLSFGMYYVKDLLEKLGVEASAVNEGQFKDAFDMFIKDEMSDATRTQVTALAEDYLAAVRDTVARNRGVDSDKAEEILTLGPYSSGAALEAGVVDRLAYVGELKAHIEEQLGGEAEFDEEWGKKEKVKAEPPSLMSLIMGTAGKPSKAEDDSPKIAVVHAMGPIIDGRADKSNPLFAAEVVASEDFIDLLDKVAEEPGVKGLVVRVDSPGGSAIASDRIWSRLAEIQDQGIPVVASMANVAASGGYYISMGADRIVAEPTTITGSIGVVGGKFSLGETYAEIGINKETISIGPHAEIYDEASTWDEDQKAIVERLLDDIYQDFLTKAAEGRGMSVDEMKQVAEGRIWSGVSAKKKGLVDELGGLDDAINITRELADAPDARVVPFPKPLTFMETIEKLLSGEMMMTPGVYTGLSGVDTNPAMLVLPREPILRALFIAEMMKGGTGVLAVMPMVVEVE